MRGAANDELYIMHAVLKGSRTLCGCRIQEVGETVDDEHSVSCKRCLRIMESDQAMQRRKQPMTIASPTRFEEPEPPPSASASGSGAFLSDVFGIYFTPQSVLDAINPPKPPDILDCICNPPRP